jgi:hypothetical protein
MNSWIKALAFDSFDVQEVVKKTATRHINKVKERVLLRSLPFIIGTFLPHAEASFQVTYLDDTDMG